MLPLRHLLFGFKGDVQSLFQFAGNDSVSENNLPAFNGTTSFTSDNDLTPEEKSRVSHPLRFICTTVYKIL